MTPHLLMQKIRLPETAQKLFLDQIPNDLLPWRTLLHTDTNALCEKLTPQTAPAVLIALAADAYAAWMSKGISEKVYVDSMYDITLWCEDYYTKHGEYGLSECGWICKSIKMELFRLGRLQFEPITLDRDLLIDDITITEGTPAFSVHIPAGEPMHIDACERSFAAASCFFGVEHPICVCGSWLLAPELPKILPETSNIVRFQKFFRILNTFPSRQAEERIYGKVLEEASLYPEQTSLQRSAKKWLLEGNTIGGGYGLRL